MKGDIKESIVDLLEKMIEEIEDLKDFQIRSKNFSSKIEAHAFKNIEKGILENLHKTNKYQQLKLLNGTYRFRYYTEFNDGGVLLEKLRNDKLEKILE